MVGIIDYGVGNLFSLRCSLESLGQQVLVSADAEKLQEADRLILPGVGAFEDAARKLRTSGLDDFVRQQAEKGIPLMGICLGMQMLFEESLEYGRHAGLGLLKGRVVPMEGAVPETLKIPHMGWNQLQITKSNSRLFADTPEGEYVYFVHSFYATGCKDSLAAVAEYGVPITAAVEKGNLFGCQFHPEKSGRAGLNILKTFCSL